MEQDKSTNLDRKRRGVVLRRDCHVSEPDELGKILETGPGNGSSTTFDSSLPTTKNNERNGPKNCCVFFVNERTMNTRLGAHRVARANTVSVPLLHPQSYAKLALNPEIRNLHRCSGWASSPCIITAKPRPFPHPRPSSSTYDILLPATCPRTNRAAIHQQEWVSTPKR